MPKILYLAVPDRTCASAAAAEERAHEILEEITALLSSWRGDEEHVRRDLREHLSTAISHQRNAAR